MTAEFLVVCVCVCVGGGGGGGIPTVNLPPHIIAEYSVIIFPHWPHATYPVIGLFPSHSETINRADLLKK